MKIALIGYGAMGKLIKTLAEEKGHEIAVVCRSPRVSEGETSNLSATPLLMRGLLQPEELAGVDVAIDFSSAEAVKRNVATCIAAGVPIVEGTTGWNEQRTEIEQIVRDGNGAFVFGANFSIGVNLFYRIVAHAAELIAKFPEYEAFIEEQHHSRKKDSPSGTALKLKDIVAEHVKSEFSVSSIRAGNIPGTHRVGFDGPADQITLTHTARSREGFAIGAIMAAEWIVGKTGFYEFGDVMDEILN
ncbi:MAG: dihydrodipicolinate reductase C-terminal domain-containing protein [Pyrinomonadaceae bacterium]